MANKQINVGTYQASWNSAHTKILKYSVEIYHSGLNEHKLITAPEKLMLSTKVDLQIKKWNEKWENIDAKKKIIAARESSLEEANLRTQEAVDAIEAVDNILKYTLNVDDTINWDTLKIHDQYSIEKPKKPTHKKQFQYPSEPKKPTLRFDFFDAIFKSRKNKKIVESEEKQLLSIEKWESEKRKVDNSNEQLETEFSSLVKIWENELTLWETGRNNFFHEQSQFNEKIDQMKNGYMQKNPESILEYCEMVLNNSVYPDFISKNFELEYLPESKILVIEYELPYIDSFPNIKEVKYISTKKEIKEFYLSESQMQKMFDNTGYNISLRTIHEIFEADVVDAIDAVSFNGWVRAINKATGAEENNCILSIQVSKIEFEKIDLSNVDAKICFRNLKGVASSKLSSLTSIQPILQINKFDKRFVESYNVAENLDSSTNIAAMNWEDFEHLVRELFEKEFQTNGGEVKVTQASRDGGVDAIAFDPDPIRGGKIVIQAKRYTNTVGVSAVRDLFGTVMNEGATKGILVSTANYGPDAYEFAKGKPLTLLNGSNLLHLLEKHGTHAKIDLKEAKRIIQERSQE